MDLGPPGGAGAVLEGAVVLGILLAAAFVVFAVRRRWLRGFGGTFDCSLRRPGSRVDSGWMLGMASYGDDTLAWFRVFSLSPRPKFVLDRARLGVLSRRAPRPGEVYGLMAGAVVVELVHQGEVDTPVEMAMTEGALTGFLAWLEAAPPGRPPAGH